MSEDLVEEKKSRSINDWREPRRFFRSIALSIVRTSDAIEWDQDV